ncbi:MAG: hypothetical protein KatS3mg124_1789 [Porticoccaceae bacterium]|nr:MAG: hypothetical protein KatS3mg124_1789 [Porticoccaceae bacterium]
MITFIVHMRVKPGNENAFEALMNCVVERTREREPGVLYYHYAKSVDAPGVYVVVEVYRDARAHAAHMESEWVRRALPESLRLLDGKPDIRQYVSAGAAPVKWRIQW